MAFDKARRFALVWWNVVTIGVASLGAQEEQPTPEGRIAVEDTKSSLTACPDCGDPVSRRAVMCPHCGCPGKAIHEAVRASEEARRPKSVVEVVTDHGNASAVAVIDGSRRFVVMDVFLLAGSDRLELRDLVTGDLVPYTAVQLPVDSRLMRLETKFDGLEFLELAPAEKEPSSYLNADGLAAEAALGEVAIQDQGQLVAIRCDGNWVSVAGGQQWTDAAPRPLRNQVKLLSKLRNEEDATKRKSLWQSEAPEKWLTPFFEKRASELVSGK